jgi:hypothetical protein
MKNLKILAKKLLKIKDKKVVPKCSDCERWGTMDCPNSYMYYSTKDKPYFKSKQDE